MNFDISDLLESWDYQPGKIVTRKFTAKDGTEKIQLRVDLGLLQMNASGRPDGKRPMGHPSLLEYYQHRLKLFVQEHDGREEGFVLKSEDCARLQLEALQYHHRYICLLQLEDHAGVIRDTSRNLAVFDFVTKYAESDELSWALDQFRPQVLMMRTRAAGTEKVREKQYSKAIKLIEDGLEQIRDFYRKHARLDLLEHSGEILSLEHWLHDINSTRPLSKRERLEIALQQAVKREDYEKAAEVRDALRNLKREE